ncbi:MetQ/NlpA family ABC transporter substrate-binding protein [Leucobacter soli]|uniref:Methionine-binding lipoprotein MetQ n=1 Tax=Leucobacter soli TaxID=2812850 RepID=A0A916JS24_9MICO|nr:MetQ/NlpA family ABC transporter substrate-binding protein [Leucobacter soli]CAG7598223.1 Methionine-binding lipoprotein MetQ [Leucobacter soli]
MSNDADQNRPEQNRPEQNRPENGDATSPSGDAAAQALIEESARRRARGRKRGLTIAAVVLAAAAVIAVLVAVLVPRGGPAENRLVVGATPVPHAEVLEVVKPILADEGIELDIVVFQDFIQPNAQLVSGELDANYYQYLPFLDNFNAENGSDLVPTVPVHIEPFGAFSEKFQSLAEVTEGATIAIPNDPVNAGRALTLLEQEGLIALATPGDPSSTVNDVADNPRNLDIVELEGAQLARSIDQVDVSFVFANYALDVGLDPLSAIFTDKGNPRYAEYLVTRPELVDDPRIQALDRALNSDAVRQFIEEEYDGSIDVAF